MGFIVLATSKLNPENIPFLQIWLSFFLLCFSIMFCSFVRALGGPVLCLRHHFIKCAVIFHSVQFMESQLCHKSQINAVKGIGNWVKITIVVLKIKLRYKLNCFECRLQFKCFSSAFINPKDMAGRGPYLHVSSRYILPCSESLTLFISVVAITSSHFTWSSMS